MDNDNNIPYSGTDDSGTIGFNESDTVKSHKTTAEVYVSPSAQAPKPARIYQTHETVFAWLAFVIGYIFCIVTPPTDTPFGAVVFIISLYAAGLAFMIMSHISPAPRSFFWLIAGALPSVGLFLSSDTFTGTLAFAWSLACFILWIDLSSHGGLETHARELFFFDTIKAFWVMPLSSLGAVFSAALGSHSHRNGNNTAGGSGCRTFIYILLGIGLAIVPTAVVIGLLLYDSSFDNHLNAVVNFLGGDIFDVISRLIFAIPITAYGFGALISAVDKKHERTMSADACRRFAACMRFAPVVMVCFAIIPLLAVYLLFFISQWDYYLAAFYGRLPTGVDIYAFYARDGFFELCGVCSVNAMVMLVANIFTKRRHPDRQNTAVRIIFGMLSVSTIILIATAFSKLALYIDQYGLTRLRIYAAWFIAVLFAAFLIMLIKQIFPRTNATLCMIVAFALLFVCIALIDINGVIADYNISGYLNGSLQKLDMSVISDCGDSAIPHLLKLCDSSVPADDEKSSAIIQRADDIIDSYRECYKNNGNIFNMTLPRTIAAKELMKRTAR